MDISLLVSDWIRLEQWEFSGATFNIGEFDYLKKLDKQKVPYLKSVYTLLLHRFWKKDKGICYEYKDKSNKNCSTPQVFSSFREVVFFK